MACLGALAGGILSGNLQGAIQGGITGGAFGAVGDAWPEVGSTGNVLGHAAVGCGSGLMSGGGCGSGALSASFSAAAAPFASNFGVVGGTVVSAVVVGTASVLGGGRFANGATTGAFGYLFNYCGHNGCWITAEERALAEAGKPRDFYEMLCRNGDAYGCGAARVVRDEAFLPRLSNIRLETALVDNGVANSRYEAQIITKAIQIDLARAYVDLLDSQGATAANPQWPIRAGISAFHDQTFTRYGAGPVFSGKLSDRYIRNWFDWCPNCK